MTIKVSYKYIYYLGKFNYNLPNEDLIAGKKISPISPQVKCDKYSLKTEAPLGLEFNEMSGVIDGTPEGRGNFHFEVVCYTNDKQLLSNFDIESIIFIFIYIIYSIT